MINLDVERLAEIQDKRFQAYVNGYGAFENNIELELSNPGSSLFLPDEYCNADAIAQMLWLKGWLEAKGEFNL